MSDYPFAPSGTGERLTPDAASNSVAAIGAGPSGGGALRIVNMSAVPMYVAPGTADTVDATNTDFCVLGSSTAIIFLAPNITHVSVQPVSGSTGVCILQRGQVLS